MKRIAVVFVLVVGIVIIAGVFGTPERESKKNIETLKGEVNEEVALVIDLGEGDLFTFTSSLLPDMTAFSLLEKSGLDLEVKNYDLGALIEAIGDKKNGEDGKYWMYYINDEMPMVAADKIFLNNGDKVEFKFKQSSF